MNKGLVTGIILIIALLVIFGFVFLGSESNGIENDDLDQDEPSVDRCARRARADQCRR